LVARAVHACPMRRGAPYMVKSGRDLYPRSQSSHLMGVCRCLQRCVRNRPSPTQFCALGNPISRPRATLGSGGDRRFPCCGCSIRSLELKSRVPVHRPHLPIHALGKQGVGRPKPLTNPLFASQSFRFVREKPKLGVCWSRWSSTKRSSSNLAIGAATGTASRYSPRSQLRSVGQELPEGMTQLCGDDGAGAVSPGVPRGHQGSDRSGLFGGRSVRPGGTSSPMVALEVCGLKLLGMTASTVRTLYGRAGAVHAHNPHRAQSRLLPSIFKTVFKPARGGTGVSARPPARVRQLVPVCTISKLNVTGSLRMS